jgi:PcRGLX-like N-terminal RIFT barrel domain
MPVDSTVRLQAIVPGTVGIGTAGREPVTFGVPLPRGFCSDVRRFAVFEAAELPTQVEALERWPDESLRWVLVDTQVATPNSFALHVGVATPPVPRPISVSRQSTQLSIDTGSIQCVFDPGPLLFTIAGGEDRGAQTVRVTALGADAEVLPVTFGAAVVDCLGPVRTTVLAHGYAGPQQEPSLAFVARIDFFTGTSSVRLVFTVRNDAAAQHAGGFWELGDRGSVLFRDLSIVIEHEDRATVAACRPAAGESAVTGSAIELYQDSSGGPQWQSRNHVNRDGIVPLSFRGFQLTTDNVQTKGLRAQPVIWTADAAGTPLVAATVRDFWQNFPKAVEASETGMTLRLFPRRFADRHELQGGEQKTHLVGLDFRPSESPPLLDWIINPAVVSCAPEWYAHCAAVPYLTAAAEDPHGNYLRFVQAAIEGPDAFVAKREIVDEYGWRNFGDMYADHESVRSSEPLISHYNNQYDAIAGLAIQFMRWTDDRWWTAMQQLAAHVVDIDIYHTTRDRAAYNGGLFWHTFHYLDAGRSTHRAFPRAHGVWGGGPSAEHDYSTGLMLQYYLTGDRRVREAVITLAEWVIAMDAGSLGRFRWLSRAQTGMATSTGLETYHGPGRGAGNSINTLLNAYRLTLDRKFLATAETFIRRCIHPDDDLAARELTNVELRWSYTVFLQSLGKYLDEKALRSELDEHYEYAQGSLLHYARWMLEHEYPYLDRPEILEFPTETWAAQDMRKCDVLNIASRHVADDERGLFAERAAFFFDASLRWLNEMPTRTLTRPLVLLLSYGYAHVAFRTPGKVEPMPRVASGRDFGQPTRFAPQKVIAIRRAKMIAIGAAAAALGAAVWAVATFVS